MKVKVHINALRTKKNEYQKIKNKIKIKNTKRIKELKYIKKKTNTQKKDLNEKKIKKDQKKKKRKLKDNKENKKVFCPKHTVLKEKVYTVIFSSSFNNIYGYIFIMIFILNNQKKH